MDQSQPRRSSLAHDGGNLVLGQIRSRRPKVQTWLLCRNPFGNSKTSLAATFAPAGETTVAMERSTPSAPVIRRITFSPGPWARATNSLPMPMSETAPMSSRTESSSTLTTAARTFALFRFPTKQWLLLSAVWVHQVPAADQRSHPLPDPPAPVSKDRSAEILAGNACNASINARVKTP